MTEQEKALLNKTNEELGEAELKRISGLVARAKRGAELLCLLPQAREELEENPENFLSKNGLTGIDPEDLKLMFYPERQAELKRKLTSPDWRDEISETVYRYEQFIGNKLYLRDTMRKVECVPQNNRMKIWRERQIERCKGALGGVNEAFIHDVMNFELSCGCSVGCEFCGVGAKKLQKVFFHTEGNAALFREVLKEAKAILGDAAGRGTLYLATEALDNPDYEWFEADFYEEFGIIPQITTAVPLRKPERTHALLKELYCKKSFIHRFSLRSLKEAREVLVEFTPDELLKVELIPQYPEAPAFVPFTISGHELEKRLAAGEEIPEQAGSICCVDGFVVNMAERSIRMITPCFADAKNPDGVAGPPKVFFEDARDFREKLLGFIDTYMVNELPGEEPIGFYDYFEYRQVGEEKALVSTHGQYTMFPAKMKEKGMQETIGLLCQGAYTKRQIVEQVVEQTGARPEKIYWYLNQLWKLGFIRDPVLFPGENEDGE